MKFLHLLGAGAVTLVVAGVLVSTRSEQAVSGGSASTASASSAVNARLAQVAPAARQDIDYQALDSRLRRLMERPAMVGMAIGVVENGRITFLRGYGETYAGSGQPITPQTVFRWASVSKGVAGTMVAKLAEGGKVDLNAPVVNYSATLKLPAAAEYRATVSDLLSHRLGLYRNAYDNKLEEGQDPQFLRQTLQQLNLICEPGSCWSYQNVAFDAASEIVARQTKLTYADTLKQQLFAPLGMTSASTTMQGMVTAKSWARPHNSGKRVIDLTNAYYLVPAAGGVNSDIKDLSLWMLAQMGQMPDVVSPRVLEAVHQPLVKTPGERRRLRKFLERLGDAWYGYGWRSYDYAGHRIVGHRGGVNGYRSLILFDPQKKSGVVALWNSSTNQPGGVEFEVMDMIYRLPFRDWMELDKGGTATPVPEDVAVSEGEAGNPRQR